MYGLVLTILCTMVVVENIFDIMVNFKMFKI